MELEIDFAIKSKYFNYHDFYSQNLKVFKCFVKVFEYFFKKEKYQNSEIKIDADTKNKATIIFCSQKYQVSLSIDPADMNYAKIVLVEMNKGQFAEIGEAIIDNSLNITFPDNKIVTLKDSYEFNNAVLNFFISGITKNAIEKSKKNKA